MPMMLAAVAISGANFLNPPVIVPWDIANPYAASSCNSRWVGRCQKYLLKSANTQTEIPNFPLGINLGGTGAVMTPGFSGHLQVGL